MTKWYDRLCDILSGHFPGWLLIVMMGVVLSEVIARYVIHRPYGAATELSGIFLVVISFMGLAYAWKEGGHIRLTLIVDRLPTRLAQRLRSVILGIMLVFILVSVKVFWDRVVYSIGLGTKTYDLGIPVAWPQAFMFIGIVLLFVWMLITFIRNIKEHRDGGGGGI